MTRNCFRRLAIVAFAAMLITASASTAFAGRGYHGGHWHHGHGHGDYVWAALGVFAGALLLDSLLHARHSQAYQPAPVYVQPDMNRCQATTGTGWLNGYRAEFSGVMCYDRYGRGYILRGSERFLRYLD